MKIKVNHKAAPKKAASQLTLLQRVDELERQVKELQKRKNK